MAREELKDFQSVKLIPESGSGFKRREKEKEKKNLREISTTNEFRIVTSIMS